MFVMVGFGMVAAGSGDARPLLQECADNVDNDEDNRVDYPADPGCASPMDIREMSAPVRLCADGQDNDVDGQIDWPNDPGCADANDNNEANPAQLPACSNTLDDDGDGTRDFMVVIGFPLDPGCDWAAEPNEADSACSDSIDNDGDGLLDYPSDPGCILVGNVLGMNRAEETDFPQCNDGRDNDGDGTHDFDPAATRDAGCDSASDTVEGAPPPPPGGGGEADPSPPAQCADGRDNDGDGRVDLADPGCASASDDDETHTITFVTSGPPPPQQSAQLLTPFPIVRLRGSADRRGVRVTLLTVRAPQGSTVTIYCTGRRCPRRRVTVTAGRRLVRVRQFEKRLRGGTILKIYVTKPGFVGKFTRFRFVTNRVPLRADRCAKTPGTLPRRCP